LRSSRSRLPWKLSSVVKGEARVKANAVDFAADLVDSEVDAGVPAAEASWGY
jgi:hypothetical protein